MWNNERGVGLPELLKKNKWAERTAARIIPLLARCAQDGRTLTYQELDKEVVRRRLGHHVMFVGYGSALDRVGRALQETSTRLGTDIPPLNALVVNAATGVPGSGCDWYMQKYTGRRREIRNKADRKAVAEEVQNMAFNFRRWNEILRLYGLPSSGPLGLRRPVVKRPQQRRGGWSSEGESIEHARLVQYIAKHPQTAGLPRSARVGLTEHCLLSGDRPDVLFRNRGRLVAAEAKSRLSNDADIERGIYQCVKYRALLRAEQKATMRIPNGAAVLVTERPLSSDLRDLADLLQVRTTVVAQRAGDAVRGS
jgi:hypothetical protein